MKPGDLMDLNRVYLPIFIRGLLTPISRLPQADFDDSVL